ncbi:MAG: prephenate dehydrogenase [Candidatus Thermofonsia bacterium]|nr:MAG: prephenate dehydrogenase [Candidatus Thermofonsia bacterium]
MITKKLCIVGLGLMGGSLALALREHVDTIVGVERHAATRQLALQNGVVDEVTADFGEGVSEADAVILATPVKSILQLLAELPKFRPEGCLVLDIGSTKAAIHHAMDNLPPQFQAVGGHPMCGKEVAGLAAADGRLFAGQTFVLCRNGRTQEEAAAFALAVVQAIGANSLWLEPERHDLLVAAVSHLPYSVSAVLMRHVAAIPDEFVFPVSASGFRDVSRLAGSDPQMMLDILLTNKTAVLQQMAQYRQQLTAFMTLLENEDETGLRRWLADAQRLHTQYRREKWG